MNLTSCCPSLRRIWISFPKALSQLVLRSETLQELEIYHGYDLRTLDLTAPNLRFLRLDWCFHNPTRGDVIIGNKVARIVAPRLDKIDISYSRGARLPDHDIHDLTSVRSLKGLDLDMHGKYCRENDTHQAIRLWFLARCTAVEHVDVNIEHHYWNPHIADKSHLVDLTKGEGKAAALFANVKSMKVTTSTVFLVRHLVPSVASLLVSCSRHLRLLTLNILVITKPLVSMHIRQ